MRTISIVVFILSICGTAYAACDVNPEDYDELKQQWFGFADGQGAEEIVYTGTNPQGEDVINPAGGPASGYLKSNSGTGMINGGINCSSDPTGWEHLTGTSWRLHVGIKEDFFCSGDQPYGWRNYYKNYTEVGDPPDSAIYDSDNDGVPDSEDCHSHDPIIGGEDTDTDGDGLLDSVDPFPDDARPFTYKKVVEYYDANGNVVGSVYKCVDDSGNVKYVTVGEASEMVQFTVDGTWKDHQTYMDTFGETALNITDENPATSGSTDGGVNPDNLISDTVADTLDQGINNDGNSLETDYLGDVVTNTKSIADNQQALLDAIVGVGNKVGQGNEIALAGSGGGSPGAGDIGEAVKESLGDQDESGTGVDYSGLDTSGWKTAPEEGEFEGVYGVDDEKAGWLTSFLNENPYKTALDNSGIQADGGGSSMTVNIPHLGSHDMDLSPLSAGFGAAGTLLLAITTLWSLIVVVRG